MQINNVDQKTAEWFELRAGKLTASQALTIATAGKGLESYIYSSLAEKFTNNHESFSTPDTERGNELEETARLTYELIPGNQKVQEVGFIEMDELVGCSPDGLVGEDGGVEIKCLNDAKFFKTLVNGEKEIEKKHIYQVQMCLLITKRDWWDLVIYNPNFEKNILIFRQAPKLEIQEKIILGIEKGKKIIKELTEKYEKQC